MHTQEPDYSDVTEAEYVYGDISELIPKDALQPLRRHVTLTHYMDANSYHDMLTGHSITGILHFMNKTPNDWYSKKQATVETVTYSSKIVVACTCIDQVKVDAPLPWCTNQGEELYVWRQ